MPSRDTYVTPMEVGDGSGRRSCLTCLRLFSAPKHLPHKAFCSERCRKKYLRVKQSVVADIEDERRAESDPVGHSLHAYLVGQQKTQESDDDAAGEDADEREQLVLAEQAAQARLRAPG